MAWRQRFSAPAMSERRPQDKDVASTMDPSAKAPIPNRAETLKVLWLMGRYAPILMLGKQANGYGTRWTIHGHPIQPPIAKYLMQSGYLKDIGETELGVRKLALTAAGTEFRAAGLAWWKTLGIFEKLKILIRG